MRKFDPTPHLKAKFTIHVIITNHIIIFNNQIIIWSSFLSYLFVKKKSNIVNLLLKRNMDCNYYFELQVLKDVV